MDPQDRECPTPRFDAQWVTATLATRRAMCHAMSPPARLRRVWSLAREPPACECRVPWPVTLRVPYEVALPFYNLWIFDRLTLPASAIEDLHFFRYHDYDNDYGYDCYKHETFVDFSAPLLYYTEQESFLELEEESTDPSAAASV
jgi:hypothetical protein